MTQDQLFELVKSLSKSEKRYFKIFSKLHVKGDQNNYIKIFDVIEKQEHYDEEKIKLYFKNDKQILKTFTFNKHYLYKLILKSLNSFHSKSRVSFTVEEDLRSAQILFQKELYKSALKILHKSEKLCIKHELFLKLLEVKRLEQKIVRKGNFLKNALSTIEQNRKTENYALKKLESISQAQYFASKVISQLYRSGANVNGQKAYSKEVKRITQFLKSKDITKIERISYSLALSAYYYSLPDNKNMLKVLQGGLNVFKKSDELVKSHFSDCISFMHNTILGAVMLNKRDELINSLDFGSQLESKFSSSLSIKEKSHLVARYHIHRVYYDLSKGNINETLKGCEKVEKLYADYSFHMRNVNKIDIMSGLADAYYFLGNYDKSLYYNSQILNLEDIERGTFPHIYIYAMLREIQNHIELKNHLLLHSLVSNTHRAIKKLIPKTQKTLHIYFEAFKTYIALADTDELKMIQNLKRIKAETIKILEADNRIIYFDMLSWIDSKIQGKDFATVKQEVFKNLYT